jgi:hypothetical protein
MKILGEFWCSDIPARKYGGVLSQKKDWGFLLELIVPRDAELPGNLCRHGITLHGYTEKGRRITLLESTYSGQTSTDGLFVYRIDISFAFEGAYIDSLEAKSLRAIQVTLDGFGNWFGKSAIKIEAKGGYSGPATIQYPGGKETHYAIEEGDLATSRSFNSLMFNSSHKPLSVGEWFGWEYKGKYLFSLTRALEIKAMWDAFFCFATFQEETPKKIYLLTDDSYDSGNRGGALLPAADSDGSTRSYFVSPLFDESDLPGSGCDSLIADWAAKYASLRMPIALLLASRKGRTPLDSRLIYLAQALEATHRNAVKEGFMTKKEFSHKIYPTLVEAIPNTCSESHVDALKAMFAHGYKFPLRARLEAIVQDNMTTLTAYKIDTARLVDWTVNERNGYTHLEWTKDRLRPELLHRLCAELDLLLTLLILAELGIKAAVRDSWVKRTDYFHYRLA